MTALYALCGIAITFFIAGWGIGRVAGADYYFYEVERLRTEIKRMRIIQRLKDSGLIQGDTNELPKD